ncbi:endocuticle structural glycoprotein SgAbd-9-like [Eupeodes corollae]|uniref:endocuticle structural glycoprotein SgAbd-9-like n=1 Tax=Eupeodes corollae TaxID=290404 RepID=UPI0024930D94|nr:endocuticle structural glycoprotein SgAbd-9-like [Eupeodes corollae]
MFKYIAILFFIGFVATVPIRIDDEEASASTSTTTVIPEISIIRSESNQDADGSYNFVFESSDGSFREENAQVINAGTDEESIKVTGSYKYTDANGQEVLVTYTADENGFVPVGTIIAKEISDNALAAKDLPKVEKEPAAEKEEESKTEASN